MNITLALTGASGAMLCREALRILEADERVTKINLVPTEHSLRVIAEELGVNGRSQLAEKLLGHPPSKVEQLNDADIGASIASGSYPVDAMIVLPCSMGTLARIAGGLADTLITRSADVMLKEERKLVLCVRETPFNKIHLRNMTLAAEAGAVIYPVIPTFYNHPVDSQAMALQYVHRVLAHVGLPQKDAYIWKG